MAVGLVVGFIEVIDVEEEGEEYVGDIYIELRGDCLSCVSMRKGEGW